MSKLLTFCETEMFILDPDSLTSFAIPMNMGTAVYFESFSHNWCPKSNYDARNRGLSVCGFVASSDLLHRGVNYWEDPEDCFLDTCTI